MRRDDDALKEFLKDVDYETTTRMLALIAYELRGIRTELEDIKDVLHDWRVGKRA